LAVDGDSAALVQVLFADAGEVPPGDDGEPQSALPVDGEAELAHDAFGGLAADRVGDEPPGHG
jgi:hypothetical protein